MMGWKRYLAVCIGLLVFNVSIASGADVLRLPCEIMESSDALNSTAAGLNGVRYLLLHQANAGDREKFSDWLKENSGSEVTFTFKHNTYPGVLCRMPHCFGRGLLIYRSEIKPEKRDIIEVTLP
ncbi:MAG: hypothetical protein U5R49_23455 [Deltaproteobacteria bacterium]|nr:hypothetical protein [Deltaproteobacteria bacterium]